MSDFEDRIFLKTDLLLASDECEERSERIIRESTFRITVNGTLFSTAMVLAGMEKEYAAGYLFSQGYITDISQIISMNAEETSIDVNLTGEPGMKPRGPVESGLTVNHEDIFTCVRAILLSPVFTETEAVHSAGLFAEGKTPIAVTEDIGRHHAFDKVIGAGLLAGTDFSRTVAASTGRLPAEMILRCRNAGIPVIATKGVPTTLGIEMAEENGITIAGLVRGNKMFVYTHPERIS